MNDNMKVRFADGVIAKVVKFDVEDLGFGLIEGDPRTCIQRQRAEDREQIKADAHLYIFSLQDRKDAQY